MIFGKTERIKRLRKSNAPGPGSYSEWSKSSKLRNEPAYSLGTGKRNIEMASKRYMPGPG